MKVEHEIETLSPYIPGLPIEEVQRRYGLSYVVKLASNENPLGPSPKVLEALRQNLQDINFYPDGSCFDLRQAVSNHLKIAGENILFGSGSDELIDLLLRTYGRRGDKVLMGPYAFNAYPIRAQASRLQVLRVPAAQGLGYRINDLIDIYRKERPPFIFIDNPNNPTGHYFTNKDLQPLLNEVGGRDDVFLIFDEAYNEFVRSKDPFQSRTAYEKYDNVILLRTFSKVHALAGLRLGVMMARPEILQYVNRVRLPFNVNLLVQKAAIAALGDSEHVQKTVQVTWQGLDYFSENLRKMKISFEPTQGNFVLIDTERDALLVHEELLKMGIILRPVKNYGLPRHLRMSVGLPDQNQKALDSLGKVFSKIPAGAGL